LTAWQPDENAIRPQERALSNQTQTLVSYSQLRCFYLGTVIYDIQLYSCGAVPTGMHAREGLVRPTLICCPGRPQARDSEGGEGIKEGKFIKEGFVLHV
jgi:hypothetical protein